MNASADSKKFVLGLEENAMDSLIHGVEHYVDGERPTDLKYTILHVFHALELFLKARLAKAHPLLIYQKPEKPINTVDFEVLTGRLIQVGVKLSKENLDDLNSLRYIRNSIEHYQIKHRRQEIEDYLGRAMRFLENFLQKELDIVLRDKLDHETYVELSEALYTYKERVERAKQEMKRHLSGHPEERAHNFKIVACAECHEETIAIPDPTSQDRSVHCFFCDAHFLVTICERCKSYILSSISSPTLSNQNEPELCLVCLEDLNQRMANREMSLFDDGALGLSLFP